MPMNLDPDPRDGRGAITRCPRAGCHALLLVDDATAHAADHKAREDWEDGVDRALHERAAGGLELAPWPVADQTPDDEQAVGL